MEDIAPQEINKNTPPPDGTINPSEDMDLEMKDPKCCGSLIRLGIYLIGAIVGAILASWCTWDEDTKTWYDSLNLPSYAPSIQMYAVEFFIFFILLAVAANHAHSKEKSPMIRHAIQILFILQIVLVVAWAYVFFCTKNISNAIMFASFALSVSVILIVLLFKVSVFAGLLKIPLLIFIILILCTSVWIQQNNV